MDDLEKFCEFVFGELTGYVYSPVKRVDSWDQAFFSWPKEKEELYDHIRTESLEANVYLAPAIYKEKKADRASFKTSQVVWIEFDGQESIDFKNVPRPDVIVQSSTSTHLHCYWRIDPSNMETVDDINYRLTYYLEADSSGWDATQILRPPSTTNWKHDLPVVLAHFEEGKHETSAFDAAPKRELPKTSLEEAELISPAKLLMTLPLGKELTDRIKNETPVEPHRSSFMMRLAYDLAEIGLNQVQITSLLYYVDERVGKFKNRRDRLLRLTQIADLALHKASVEDSIVLYNPRDVLLHTDDLDWIIPGWLHSTGMMMITGAPGVGKTQAAVNLATNLMCGLQFLNKGIPNKKVNKVLFLSLEMDIRELKYIFSHQSRTWPQDFPWQNFYIADESGSYTQYENLIEQVQPDVIIIDSLFELVVEEMTTAEARTIMKWLKKIRRKYNSAVIVIHHNRKATEGNKKPKGLSDVYGSYLFGKDTETVISLYEERSKLELLVLKARFATKDMFFIERTEHLTFERVAQEKGQDENANQDPKRNPISAPVFGF